MSDNGRLIINGKGEMFQAVTADTKTNGRTISLVRLQVTSHVGNLDTVPGGQFTLSSDLTPSEAIALACKLADAAGYAATFTDVRNARNTTEQERAAQNAPNDFFTRPLEGGKIPPEETRVLPRGSEHGALRQRIRDAAENGDPNAARYLKGLREHEATLPPVPVDDEAARAVLKLQMEQVWFTPAKRGEGK